MIFTHHAPMAGSLSLSQAIITSLEKLALLQGLENCLRAKSVLMPPYRFVYILSVPFLCDTSETELWRQGLSPALQERFADPCSGVSQHLGYCDTLVGLGLPYPLDPWSANCGS